MLTFINELPTDKKIAGVHTIPITEQGNIIMAWDEDEQILTTIGGRVEENESLEEALAREVMEESGITLHEEKIPFASWYWDSTNTYTVWYLSRVDQYVSNTFTLEKTGYVIQKYEVELPICNALYEILFENKDAKETLEDLFLRPVKFEF